ncbi:MAG: hypothetical protein JXB23_16360, partial [Candidatus Aminicenantes bacterium]|nr:hypothetical protein [Candidatus Aminicenantes bacterium]
MYAAKRLLFMSIILTLTLFLSALQGISPLQTEDNPMGGSPLTVFQADLKFTFASFGDNIGRSSIVIAPNGSYLEIYVAASSRYSWGNDYWYALRYDVSTREYRQIYVSPYFPDEIRRLDVADVVGDSETEIIIALENGDIHFFNQATKEHTGEIATEVWGLGGLGVADVDGDSEKEIVICNYSNLYVYSGTGSLEWSLQG